MGDKFQKQGMKTLCGTLAVAIAALAVFSSMQPFHISAAQADEPSEIQAVDTVTPQDCSGVEIVPTVPEASSEASAVPPAEALPPESAEGCGSSEPVKEEPAEPILPPEEEQPPTEGADSEPQEPPSDEQQPEEGAPEHPQPDEETGDAPESTAPVENTPVEIEPAPAPQPGAAGGREAVSVPQEPQEAAPPEYWEAPPAWAQTGQAYIRGNLLAAAEMQSLETALEQRTEEMKTALPTETVRDERNKAEHLASVLAVYAVKQGQTADFPYDVEISGDDGAQELHAIYWAMTRVTGVSNVQESAVEILQLDISQAAKALDLTEQQIRQAQSLVTEDTCAEVQEILNGSILTELTDKEIAQISEEIPADVTGQRRAVLMAALSLEGKVGYFWGGKSLHVGWDNAWGELRTVTAADNETTGTVQKMGLDCSGFIEWAFVNAAGDMNAAEYIGSSTSEQYKNSEEIAWKDAQPGDLLFYQNPSEEGVNHVGLVVAVDEMGPQRVVHCTDGWGVTVTGSQGFVHARRPFIYNEE